MAKYQFKLLPGTLVSLWDNITQKTCLGIVVSYQESDIFGRSWYSIYVDNKYDYVPDFTLSITIS